MDTRKLSSTTTVTLPSGRRRMMSLKSLAGRTHSPSSATSAVIW